MCVIDENDMKDYNIQIDSELYNRDYDEVDFENQIEQSETTQTDILFE